MEHLKWPKELCLQVPVAFGLNILAVQPNFIAGGVTPRFDSFIMTSFLKFLGIVEIFPANNHQFFEFR